MSKKDLQIAAIVLVVCAAICTTIWYANEGRGGRPEPTAAPSPVPALLAPSQPQSAIVTSVSAPVGLQATVPSIDKAFEKMKSGKVRVMFEFEPKDAAAAESLAQRRGEALWVQVTRGK